MTLDCTRISLLKLKRYKLNKQKAKIQEKPETPISFLSIQDGEAEAVDLDDITLFLERDVELDATLIKP